MLGKYPQSTLEWCNILEQRTAVINNSIVTKNTPEVIYEERTSISKNSISVHICFPVNSTQLVIAMLMSTFSCPQCFFKFSSNLVKWIYKERKYTKVKSIWLSPAPLSLIFAQLSFYLSVFLQGKENGSTLSLFLFC